MVDFVEQEEVVGLLARGDLERSDDSRQAVPPQRRNGEVVIDDDRPWDPAREFLCELKEEPALADPPRTSEDYRSPDQGVEKRRYDHCQLRARVLRSERANRLGGSEDCVSDVCGGHSESIDQYLVAIRESILSPRGSQGSESSIIILQGRPSQRRSLFGGAASAWGDVVVCPRGGQRAG